MMNHYDLANLSKDDLKDVFTFVSNKKGLKTALVEKDFWVTFVLKYLFISSPFKSSLLFKGGTCLSKCYGAIERFSEDIDIVLDWRILGYDINGPNVGKTNKQTEKINNEMVERTKKFLSEKFIPTMKADIREIISYKFDLALTDNGIVFRYPVLFETSSVKSEILLEIGPRGSWINAKKIGITSYVSEIMPDICDESIPVICTPIERAFCEKILIIHTVASRKKMPNRYSRHYYDVYSMRNAVEISKMDEIIRDTVQFKRRFFPGNNYGYDTMIKGQFSLSLPDELIDVFKSDYRSMEEMIYGQVPSIDEIKSALKKMENQMNN